MCKNRLVKKYVMLLMNEAFVPQDVELNVPCIEHYRFTVCIAKHAIEFAKKLASEGFGEELANPMYESTDKKISVGYETYAEKQKSSLQIFWERIHNYEK